MNITRYLSWPLLLGALAVFMIAVGVGHTDSHTATVEAMVVIGSVLIGAWIALLARSGYSGLADTDDDDDRPDDTDD